MTFSTSSAEPRFLDHYAQVMLAIDTELYGQVSVLTSSLQAFESRCRERQFRLPVSQIPEDLMSHVRRAEGHEQWMFSVAQAFVDADSWGIPATAAELYEWIENPPNADMVCYEHPDITIVRIGPDEYLILVRGTRGSPGDWRAWFGAANTWLNNLYSGFGNRSDYSEQLRFVIEKAGLPAGSKLHFAGHSQGGHAALIAANEIADGNKYKVASYTGFGTYYNQNPNPKIPVYNVYNYDNDPVGLIGQGLRRLRDIEESAAAAAAIAFGSPIAVLFRGIDMAKKFSEENRDPQISYIGGYTQQHEASTQISSSVAGHNAYEEANYLANIPVAWSTSNTFEVLDTYVSVPGPRQQVLDNTIETVGAAADKCKDMITWSMYQASKTVNQTVNLVQETWDTTADAAKDVGNAVVGSLIDWFDL